MLHKVVLTLAKYMYTNKNIRLKLYFVSKHVPIFFLARTSLKFSMTDSQSARRFYKTKLVFDEYYYVCVKLNFSYMLKSKCTYYQFSNSNLCFTLKIIDENFMKCTFYRITRTWICNVFIGFSYCIGLIIY